MKLRFVFGLICYAVVAGRWAAVADEKHPSARWESTIRKFEAADDKQMPPKQAILFVGSSSIRLWDLKESFPDEKTINRGFGGSEVADSLYFADRIVTKYEPRQIIMYAGDNDIGKGKSPETVAKDFRQFVKKVRQQLSRVGEKLKKVREHLSRVEKKLKKFHE